MAMQRVMVMVIVAVKVLIIYTTNIHGLVYGAALRVEVVMGMAIITVVNMVKEMAFAGQHSTKNGRRLPCGREMVMVAVYSGN